MRRRTHRFDVLEVVLALLASLWVVPSSAAPPAERIFGDFPPRAIGPAVISGRVMAIAGSPDDSLTVYAGGATSGLWKTLNGGTSWIPIFDDTGVSSVGAVTVHPKDPQLLFVGTGEPKPRYGTGSGNGVYRSRDGGATWEHLGLANTERIQRVLAHPDDPDVLYVAAVGPARRDSAERGVFRSRDGGESWERVLFTNPKSGAADLAMDPADPNRLLAAMWEYRRQPWSFVSGGAGSGLFLSEDGGDTWRQLSEHDGLPPGTLGRIGIAFAPSAPERVYAVVEAERNGLFRSDDGGRRWSRIGDPEAAAQQYQFGILGRPWYFQLLFVDPGNEDRVYHAADRLFMSEDGGATFTAVDRGDGVHSDHQYLWINPNDTRELWAGTDGGLYVSRDRGEAWQFIDKLPWAQLYHVNVDQDLPYNLYTSAQDQANWVGPSSVWNEEGIAGHHWQSVEGGESGPVLPVPGDSRYVYGFANMGHFYLTDRLTGDVRVITPYVDDIDTAIRRNNAPAAALDPFDAEAVYYGSQFLHRSPDRGRTWRILSPDLTSNDPAKQRYFEVEGLTWENFGGELHTTIVSIGPSAADRDVIWVGTDDGNIQVTRDGGRSWANTSSNLPNAPKPGFWVQQVLPSATDAATALVVVNDHRRGDDSPYVYRTTDFGESWESLVTDTVQGVAWAIEQDPGAHDLLFLGTSAGLYASLDGGESWLSYPHLPPAQVRGLKVHPREGDLVIATFGRGAFIIDDIRAWRSMASEPTLADASLELVSMGPVQQYRRQTFSAALGDPYYGDNELYGAFITAWLGGPLASAARVAEIEIRNDEGERVSAFEETIRPGLNRFHWDLRYSGAAAVPSYYHGWPSIPVGDIEVPHGSYRVTVSVGGYQAADTLEVRPDPRLGYTAEDRRKRVKAMLNLRDNVIALLEGYSRARELAARLRDWSIAAHARNESNLAQRAEDVAASLLAASDRIRFTFEQDEVIVEPYDEVLRREWPGGVLDYVTRVVNRGGSSWDAPSPNQQRLYRHAFVRMERVAGGLNAVLAEDYRTLRNDAAGSSLERLPDLPIIALAAPDGTE